MTELEHKSGKGSVVNDRLSKLIAEEITRLADDGYELSDAAYFVGATALRLSVAAFAVKDVEVEFRV
jgi:hypothetical protein